MNKCRFVLSLIFIVVTLAFSGCQTGKVANIEEFLQKKQIASSETREDSFKESYRGICVEKGTSDVAIKNCSQLQFLNPTEDRISLFNLLKEAKSHIKAEKKYPLAFLEEPLWNPELTNDLVAILDTDSKPHIFQSSYIEHLLAAKGFRDLILNTIDDGWDKKKAIETLFEKMLFARALGQTGVFQYNKEGKLYISIGLEHPKGVTLAPSGFITRDLGKKSHLLSGTLAEETHEELSPTIDISKMSKKVVGYAVNDITAEKKSYYDANLLKKLSTRGIASVHDVKFVRGLFITVAIDEIQASSILKDVKITPGIDFKKEIGVFQFQTIEDTLKTLYQGYKGKQNIEHIVILEAYNKTLIQ